MSGERAPRVRRRLKPSFWLSERVRATAAMLVSVATAVVSTFFFRSGELRLTMADAMVFVLVAYLLAYLVITAAAFVAAEEAVVRRWAARESRGTWVQRYLTGTAPGPGLGLLVAAVSVPTAVAWLPSGAFSSLPPAARLSLGVALLVLAWISMLASFTITFYADNAVEDEAGLHFPGGNPGWASYFYFAVSIATTFGTTDVEVRSEAIRKTVAINAIVAFVFNTVIIAAAVSTLASVGKL